MSSTTRNVTYTDCAVNGCGFRAKSEDTLGILIAHYHMSHPEWDFVRCVRTADCPFTIPVPLAAHANILLRAHYKTKHGTVLDVNPGTPLPGNFVTETPTHPTVQKMLKVEKANQKKRSLEEAVGGMVPQRKKGPGVDTREVAPLTVFDNKLSNRYVVSTPEDVAIFEMRLRMCQNNWDKNDPKSKKMLEAMKREAHDLAELAKI